MPSAVAPDQRQGAAEAACFDVVELGRRGAFFGRKLAVILQSAVSTVWAGRASCLPNHLIISGDLIADVELPSFAALSAEV